MLAVEGITKKYGDAVALAGVSFELLTSELLAVVGPSGSGKSTLLRVITGFERPDSGKVLIDGMEASTPSYIMPPHLRNISLIFQDLALWPHMSASEHIEFVLQRENLAKNELRSRTHWILEKVSLHNYKGRYPHELSGGERQRLAIARSIASNPACLLMDEPFSNVDTILKEDLQELVFKLKNELQTSIIYVTHNIEEALLLADRLAIINEGKILQIDKKDKVVEEPHDDFVKRLLKMG
jgi:ABC-type Fe3+/spermidine/putrescine transport system ATPase subunit